MTVRSFQKLIWSHFKKHKRDLPWRKNINPYRILVSEIMLQQTQVSRVVPKYRLFLKLFPNIRALEKAPTERVLKAWSGLGYNRRALYLKRIAAIVTKECGGKLPQTAHELTKLPGIGSNTAGSILAYAFNKPAVFIETNIRKIYLHHFFKKKKNVPDSRLLPLVEQTLPILDFKGREKVLQGRRLKIREWYWALMDYGKHLSTAVENPNTRSKHYAKQSKFAGSLRQLRGKIVNLLLAHNAVALSRIAKLVADNRWPQALGQLETEGFIEVKNKKVYIKK